MHFLPFYYLPGDFPVYPMYWNQPPLTAKSFDILPLRKATINNKANHFIFASGNHFRIYLKAISPGKTFKSKTPKNTEIFLMVESGQATIEYLNEANELTKEVMPSGSAIIIPADFPYQLTNGDTTSVKIYFLSIRSK